MTKFIQIHALTGYSAALINRDDTGLAKRINFGGKIRTRISSQCQKRAWRMNEGADAIADLADQASDIRTKMVIEKIVGDLVDEGIDAGILSSISDDFVKAVYGKNAVDMKKRQGLLFSGREVTFLTGQMRAAAASEDPVKASADFTADYAKIMQQMRSECAIPHGLTASLFGRMVTSDVAANVDAAIHVAHAFTVHADRAESDYFTAVDDLKKDDDSGAGHLGDVEIASGLFYGYVTVDVDLLVSNLGGDRELAAEVVRRLVRMIASVSPGAKRGSTAPYGYASSMLVEAGDAQPRSLAEAYRKPIYPETHEEAEKAMAERLKRHDATYATGEERIWLSMRKDPAFEGRSGNLAEVADFAAAKVIEA